MISGNSRWSFFLTSFGLFPCKSPIEPIKVVIKIGANTSWSTEIVQMLISSRATQYLLIIKNLWLSSVCRQFCWSKRIDFAKLRTIYVVPSHRRIQSAESVTTFDEFIKLVVVRLENFQNILTVLSQFVFSFLNRVVQLRLQSPSTQRIELLAQCTDTLTQSVDILAKEMPSSLVIWFGMKYHNFWFLSRN